MEQARPLAIPPFNIVVVSAPSGSALTAATTKIVCSLERKGLRVEVADIEDEFVRVFREDYPGADPSADGPMQDVLFKLPRDAVTQFYWPAASARACEKLLRSDADIRLLRCHLTYYRDKTREYYVAGDLNHALEAAVRTVSDQTEDSSSKALIGSARIAVVLTLIDDVFDMFHRLSVDSHVFPLSRNVAAEYRRRKLEGRDRPSDPDGQYLLAFEQVITILHRLLEWRSREMTSGEVLAVRCNAEHFVLAAKHPVETAARVIELARGDAPYVPVYLSHPISRPRKEQKQNSAKAWGKFVVEFQTFVESASELDVHGKRPLFFMPTAIDEYRFTERADPQFPSLERRWPLIEHESGLLYEAPGGTTYDEFETERIREELFNPVGGHYDVDRELATKLASSAREVPGLLSDAAKNGIEGLIKGLLQQLRIQLSIRDHALVRQTGRLLLYRPFFGEGRLSGGVEAELDNWSNLIHTADEFASKGRTCTWRRGPAVFVHDEQDLAKIKELSSQRIKVNLHAALIKEFGRDQSAMFVLDRVSGPTEAWFDMALIEGDELLGGAPLSGGERTRLKLRFEHLARQVIDETRKMAHVGSSNLDRKHAFRYERLTEKTSRGLRHLAEADILPRLLE